MSHNRTPTHYETLGITRDFPPEAVRGLRANLAKLYHPDGGSQPDAARMRRVNDACDVIGDAGSRLRYDRELDARARRWHEDEPYLSPHQRPAAVRPRSVRRVVAGGAVTLVGIAAVLALFAMLFAELLALAFTGGPFVP